MTFYKQIKDNILKYFAHKNKGKGNKSSKVYKNSTTKRTMNECCSLEFSSETEKINKEIKAQAKEIVKRYFKTPEKLIQYMRTIGAKVYRSKNAEKLLSKIGEEEGLITPIKGLKASYINLLINEKLSLRTPAVFIFDVNNTEIYTIARAFYKYMCYEKKMPGYDYKSQETFKKLYNKRHHSSPFNNCNIDDIYACKEALNRDVESINFTLELSVEYENSKKASNKLASESSINI